MCAVGSGVASVGRHLLPQRWGGTCAHTGRLFHGKTTILRGETFLQIRRKRWWEVDRSVDCGLSGGPRENHTPCVSIVRKVVPCASPLAYAVQRCSSKCQARHADVRARTHTPDDVIPPGCLSPSAALLVKTPAAAQPTGLALAWGWYTRQRGALTSVPADTRNDCPAVEPALHRLT